MRQRRIFGSAVVLSLALLLFFPPLVRGEIRPAPFRPAGLEAIPTTAPGGGYALRLAAPEVRLDRSADGTIAVQVDGYPYLQSQPGVPQIPMRMVRVAIPAGAVPRLEVRPGKRQVMAGVRPGPVPRIERTVDTAGVVSEREVLMPNRDVYESVRPFPEKIAWLGEFGTLRDQRYVELFLAPVRYAPAVGGLELYPDLEVEVLFDAAPGPVSLDPVFEDIYRNAFVNYAQGATFRLGSREAAAATMAVDSLTGTRYRIPVREYGVVRLDFGLMSGTDLITEPLSTWSVISQGVQVPIHIFDSNSNDLMDGNDWVHFYAQPMDEEPKARLNQDYPEPAIDLYEASDFTDENIYFIGVETGAVTRMTTQDGTPTYSRVPPAEFEATARMESDDLWRPLGGADPWYWQPTLDSADPAPSRTVSEMIALPGLAGAAGPITVRANLRGVSTDPNLTPDHSTRVTLKNDSSQTLALDDATFDDRTLYLHDFTWTWSSGPLASDPLEVEVEVRAIASGNHTVLRDWIEIDYPRAFLADADRLEFRWPDGDAEFEITGFDTPPVAVYELSARVGASNIFDAVRLTGVDVNGSVGNWSARFRMDNDPGIPDGELRRFIVLGTTGVTIPSGPDFTADTASDLLNTATQADLIVIAHPDVAGAGSTLQDLLDYRLLEQGITSKIAWIQDVYDDFNTGLPGPDAIRNFLSWVLSDAPGEGWADPKPRYVLLLGDGSYDYKGGAATKNFIPTQIMFKDDPNLGYYTSDNLLAAVVGDDQLADLIVGRISSGDIPSANLIIDKILTYSQSPPAGNWRRHALFISDQGKNNNANEALEFEAINDQGESYIKIPPHTSRKLRYWSDFGNGTQTANMRQAIKDAVNGTDGFSDGAAVAQYTGHGNFVVWSDDAFFDERFPASLDTDDLVNGYRLPWLVNHNCLTGGFHTLQDNSMGEDWMKRSGGGAMSVYAPSGLGSRFIGEVVTDRVFGDLYGPPKTRQIGQIVMDAQVDLCGQGSFEACQFYVLLGDPTTRLVLREIEPPQNLLATGGHQLVDLSWTASSTSGVTYDVYRTDNLLLGYSKVLDSHPGTTWQDTGLVNNRTYYYYVLAKDGEGFESRWSNFNSDCDVSGPDCVSAIPLNPNPPGAPSGVTVVDTETGGRLDVSWLPNPESDIQVYDVHYGTSPGVYTQVQPAGTQTSAVLAGLPNGVRHYIVVTATNTSSLTSAFSTEVDEVPTFIPGLRPPAFIETLVLEKQGTDLRLSWTPVTTDIYGKDETVAEYQIYRDLTPDFLPTPANLIGTVTLAEFTDSAVLQGGTPDYHYLVRAVDTEGNLGGLGHQLPQGIADLVLAKSTVTVGNLELTWAPVSTTFDGDPTVVQRYDLYAADTPFTRQDIADGAVPLLRSVTAASAELEPVDQRLFYSVVVVDRRGQISPF